MENWESEFLQMGVFIFFTAFLYQKGSAESKDPEKREEVDRDPRNVRDKQNAPWPVRRGGWILTLYESSLSLAFLFLFLASFLLHAASGRSEYNEEQLLHGSSTVSIAGYLGTSRFWFESFQNWQSEFLAIGCMVLFTIHLRQRGAGPNLSIARRLPKALASEGLLSPVWSSRTRSRQARVVMRLTSGPVRRLLDC